MGLDSGDRLDVVQVPLTFRGAPLEGHEHALIGTATHSTLGERWVYDGVHDPVFVRAWLRLVADQAEVPGAAGTLSDAPDAPRVDPGAAATVLSGEQSNTSVVVGAGAPDPLIVKLFRVLSDGPNPDVEVTSALSRAGVRAVPRVAGWVSGEWVVDEQPCRGHLAVATEFLAGSQDAWREALAAAVAGRPFTTEADELGAATASVHTALREQFGTQEATDDVRRDLVTALQGRVDWAVGSSGRADDAARAAGPPPRAPGRPRRRGRPAAAARARRLPPRPGAARARPRLGAARLRGRAAASAARAHPSRRRAARRRGHAPLVRLRRRARRAAHPGAGGRRAGAALGAGGADGVPGRLPARRPAPTWTTSGCSSRRCGSTRRSTRSSTRPGTARTGSTSRCRRSGRRWPDRRCRRRPRRPRDGGWWPRSATRRRRRSARRRR